MGGSSASTSQKGFFPACSFTSLSLSSALSSTLSSCLFDSASTLLAATAGLSGGGGDGEASGSVLGVSTSPPTARPPVRPAHLVLVGGLENGVWASAAVVTLLLKSSNKAEITNKHGFKTKPRLHRNNRTSMIWFYLRVMSVMFRLWKPFVENIVEEMNSEEHTLK